MNQGTWDAQSDGTLFLWLSMEASKASSSWAKSLAVKHNGTADDIKCEYVWEKIKYQKKSAKRKKKYCHTKYCVHNWHINYEQIYSIKCVERYKSMQN